MVSTRIISLFIFHAGIRRIRLGPPRVLIFSGTFIVGIKKSIPHNSKLSGLSPGWIIKGGIWPVCFYFLQRPFIAVNTQNDR